MLKMDAWILWIREKSCICVKPLTLGWNSDQNKSLGGDRQGVLVYLQQRLNARSTSRTLQITLVLERFCLDEIWTKTKAWKLIGNAFRSTDINIEIQWTALTELKFNLSNLTKHFFEPWQAIRLGICSSISRTPHSADWTHVQSLKHHRWHFFGPLLLG